MCVRNPIPRQGQNRVLAVFAAIFTAFLFGSTIGVQNASAETLYATTVANELVSFDSSNPCEILSAVKIMGLAEGEDILGIDSRPATGELYALGSSSRLYVIDTNSGMAQPIGSGPFTPALEGTSFGFDFNPTVDRIRIISNTGQNLRAHPTLGTIVFVDGDLAYVEGDVNFGTSPYAVGAAYTNSDRDPSTGTTLYDLDSALDILALQNPPNNGGLVTLGMLGINTNDVAGFDISTSNTAYIAVVESGKTRRGDLRCGTSSLASVNLMTGASTVSEAIGTPQPVRGLAAYIGPPFF